MVRKVITQILYPVLIVGTALCLAGMVQAATGNIDDTDKWAWGANAGWNNFKPTHGGVTVYPDHLEGYAYEENIGWIRMGSHTGGGTHHYDNTSNTNYGVNLDASGNLSGYAWGKDIGWINFAPTNGGVTIDLATGSFDGYVWGENIEWIHFKNASPAYNVVVNLPTANAGAGDTIFSGTCAVLNGSASGGTPPYNYSWSPTTGLSNPNDSTTNACPTTTTTYTLTVTDNNGCTDDDRVTVTVNLPPTANAGSDVNVCTGTCAILGDSPTATGGTPPYTYLWTPNTGLSSDTAANPQACPDTTTTYTLTVTDSIGCADTAQITVSIYEIVADFTANPTSGCSPLEVDFSDSSLGNITSWTWDFGDGNTSPDTSPTHTFVRTGDYLVILTVSSAQGSDSAQMSIHVDPGEVVAAFLADLKGTEPPLTVCFTDISTGIVTYRIWDFENDGRFTSTESSPCHTYTELGEHTAKLMVVGPCGGDFVKMTFEITEKVEAGFTGSPLRGCAPLEVQFSDGSAGTVISRTWDFGDGGTSAEANPVHTYTEPGLYSVSLFVYGEEMNDSVTRSAYITVLDGVTAGFQADPVSGIAPLEVAFSDSSTGNTQDYLWDFGDGTTSPDPTPSHFYLEPGIYNACLTISGECGTDTHQVIIKVSSPAKWQTFNYPNPFNPVDGKEVTAPDGTATDGTIITYTLPDDIDDEALVSIYTIAGELVRKFKLSGSKYQEKGEHYLVWDGRNGRDKMVASGVYLYHIKAGRYKEIHKMAVIK